VPRPKQRTPELRDHVLTVALDVLARGGVVGFTTRNIARQAATSTPAVYELFGDKSGLVREIFFEGFRLLRCRLDDLKDTEDPEGDLLRMFGIYREFIRSNPVLAEVMFSRPFTDFDPGPSEVKASGSVRTFIVEHVRRCTENGALTGDETDIAHVLVALTQGLAGAENARRLGTSKRSVDRRWTLAFNAVLAGFAQ
jgi:AcrR family transcriptional regulator